MNKSIRRYKVVDTSDGSATLYSKEFDECYHSTKDGALSESLYKHIIPAFNLVRDRDKLVILDICFGLGYNTLATLYYIKEHNIDIEVEIVSPEMDRELVALLSNFDYPKEFEYLQDTIDSLAKYGKYENNRYKIDIHFADARQILPKLSQKFDIVYQDAFSPKKNPLLWTKEYFKDVANLIKPDGIITTYSSATPVRMGLYENGFNIYTHPKGSVREGTIASFAILNLPAVDMELKKQRNPQAKALFDSEFIY